MPKAVALLMFLLCALPAAQAATLSDFEEPVRGTDKVYPFTLTEEEANLTHALLFLGSPTRPFGLLIYNARGETVYERNGTLGIQQMPELPPGEYRFFLRGDGGLQVANKTIGVANAGTLTDVEANLSGGVDAYILADQRSYTFQVTGDVTYEVRELPKQPVTYESPGEFNLTRPFPLVLLVRGEPGTPYAFTLTEFQVEEEPETNGTPGPGLLALFAGVGIALAMRRRLR